MTKNLFDDEKSKGEKMEVKVETEFRCTYCYGVFPMPKRLITKEEWEKTTTGITRDITVDEANAYISKMCPLCIIEVCATI